MGACVPAGMRASGSQRDRRRNELHAPVVAASSASERGGSVSPGGAGRGEWGRGARIKPPSLPVIAEELSSCSEKKYNKHRSCGEVFKRLKIVCVHLPPLRLVSGDRRRSAIPFLRQQLVSEPHCGMNAGGHVTGPVRQRRCRSRC